MKKKIKWLLLLSISLFLAGCSVPFVTPVSELVETYTQTQAELIASSMDVDKQLTDHLGTLPIKEAEVFNPADFIHAIRDAISVQQNILGSIQQSKVPYGQEEMQHIYSQVVRYQLDSYEQYIQILEKNNLPLFQEAVKKHQLAKQGILEKSLVELNGSLKKAHVEARSTLLPIKEEKK